MAHDPIFAAIERHKEAWRVFEVARVATDGVAAHKNGRDVTQADEAGYTAANQAEEDALADLLSLPAVTVAGMRAVLEYAIEFDDSGYDDVLSALAPTLLESPLLAS